MEEERDKYTRELMNMEGNAPRSVGASGSVIGKVGEMSEEEKRRKKKGRIKAIVIGGIVGLAIILSGLLISLLLKQEEYTEEDELFAREETKVAVFVAPMSAEVKIDGEAYLNGVYEFLPGEYRVEITATGYKPRVYNLEVVSDKVTLLYDYLEKESGVDLTEKDVDLLRYLANDDDTIRKIEEYLFTTPEDYQFPSSEKSPVRNFEILREFYRDSINDYSYELIRETLDAYFYFARSGTKNVYLSKESLEEVSFRENEYITKVEFRVSADRKDDYRVRLEINRSQVDPERTYKVLRATVVSEAGTSLFQYDGRFTKEEEYEGFDADFDESDIYSNDSDVYHDDSKK